MTLASQGAICFWETRAYNREEKPSRDTFFQPVSSGCSRGDLKEELVAAHREETSSKTTLGAGDMG